MHYKSLDNSVHSLDSAEYEHLLPSGSVQITDAEADTLRAANAPVLTYAQLRAAEYPPMTDYLDGIAKGDTAQVNTYIAACLAVKAKYPKE
tara:strand:- start:249 stop:521 length:273 start_codon:yes stop_codon:yes gene_type:complete